MAWHSVGWVKDAHGLKGELYIQLHAKKADWLKNLKTCRLVHKVTGAEQIFVPKRVKPHKLGLILLPEGFSDRNQAEAVKGFDFSIPREILVSDDQAHPYLIEILGFQVEDKTLGAIGAIESFESNGAQDIFVVKYQGREVLIPFVDAFVVRMDREARVIQMDLPPGLIDEN